MHSTGQSVLLPPLTKQARSKREASTKQAKEEVSHGYRECQTRLARRFESPECGTTSKFLHEYGRTRRDPARYHRTRLSALQCKPPRGCTHSLLREWARPLCTGYR